MSDSNRNLIRKNRFPGSPNRGTCSVADTKGRFTTPFRAKNAHPPRKKNIQQKMSEFQVTVQYVQCTYFQIDRATGAATG